MKVKIGLHLTNQHGDMHRVRETWEEAEALGVDRIFFVDHFLAQDIDGDSLSSGNNPASASGKNFESTTLQAAAAATTKRVEIGCTVHSVGFRNPNLLADIARTIDHISGGRYILGIGSGYLKEEYDEYGYTNFGTAKSRMLDLIDAIDVIKARFEKLNPQPMRKIPLLIAAQGEKLGMPLAARHTDIWHVYGPVDKIRQKMEAFKNICHEVGRNPEEIEIMGTCDPHLIQDNNFDTFYHELGLRSLSVITQGPKFDLGLLREIIQWRKSLG
jgi:probable F420-dependent oxidoreductase